MILTSANWSTGTVNCPSATLATSAVRGRQPTAWERYGLVTAQHWKYANKCDNSLTTHFGLLSPSGVDGSTGFVSSSGDGELGRSLSPEKSVLSRSGRLRPPLPRARRAHERSEQEKVLSLWTEQERHSKEKTVSLHNSYQDCPKTCAHGYHHDLMIVRSPSGLIHPPQKGLCYADASGFHLVSHLKRCHLFITLLFTRANKETYFAEKLPMCHQSAAT